MASGTRIGILGGTFDPIHVGHVDTALAAHRALALDHVLVMPSGTPPHRPSQPSASRFHRFAMVALAVTGLPGLMLSDLEIGVTGPCYTFDTLVRLHQTGLVASQIYFIAGADAFAEIETWHRYPEVLELAHFVVVSRPGHRVTSLSAKLPALAARMKPAADLGSTAVDAGTALDVLLVDTPTRDVSSTEVRRRLAAGASIVDSVPSAVATYIDQHGLYSRGDPATSFGRPLA